MLIDTTNDRENSYQKTDHSNTLEISKQKLSTSSQRFWRLERWVTEQSEGPERRRTGHPHNCMHAQTYTQTPRGTERRLCGTGWPAV